MTPERWQQIATIYELAADQAPAARETFLTGACAGDRALRDEVESLLGQDGAAIVLDRSVWATAAALFPAGSPPASLGPYRVDSLLGAGGMGEVFRALDTRLNRAVAIKVLPTHVALDPGMRIRFAGEARAIASLTHPHICTLYDVGRDGEVDFLVMEYLEGHTLAARLASGPLPFGEALARASEIAGALDHAHRHAVIHRDLKPANIMLTESGAKLLDFGLAKLRPRADGPIGEGSGGDGIVPGIAGEKAGEPPAGESALTRGGAVLGTVRYMAPEQITGGEVDGRSDLFSFGAVLFEMLTGRRAFDGDNTTSIRTAILEQEPPPVSSLQPLASPVVDDIVRRCLAKCPDERWQTAGDLSRALTQAVDEIVRHQTAPSMPGPAAMRWSRWTAGLVVGALLLAAWLSGGSPRQAKSEAGGIRSIAVLPLDNLSSEPDQEYFADGMTQQLIADLAKIGALRVISDGSVMHYRQPRKSAKEIARELKVDAIVDGSVARVSDKVKITARLVSGTTGKPVWAQTLQRDLRDVLALQNDLARAIANEVDIHLTPEEEARLTAAPAVDPEVDRRILLGRYHAGKATEEGLRRAVRYFGDEVTRDPGNARAQAGLADAYAGLSGYYMDPREAMPRAKQAAEAALRLDDSLASAHATLGLIHLVYDWDAPGAERSLLRALALNPTLADARLNYAAYLTTQARNDDAVREIRRAVDLDPLSIRTHSLGTLFLLFTRQYDEAIELARRGLEFEPDAAFALAFQGIAYAAQGRFPEAVANLQRAAQLDDSLTILALQAHVFAVAGQPAEAERLLRQVEDAAQHRYFCPYEIATVYVSLGDHDSADKWLRKGTRERADCMAWLGVEPWIDSFRRDSRYAGLLRDIGLDPLRGHSAR